MANRKTTDVTPSGWVGWVFFASVMMLIYGGMQIISGLVGIFRDDFYAVSSTGVVVFDVTTWGWINLVLGIVYLLTGFGLLAGATWARIVGVFFTVLAILANVAFLPVYPLWSLISIVVGGFVVYALSMHGGELSNK